MSNKQQSEKTKSKSQLTDKKVLIIGSIVATLIAITPYLFYLYESVPQIDTWDTFLFSYTSTYYENVFVLAWTLTGKIIPLYLLLIWFFTCRHWWHHVILIPIAMYAYQIISTIAHDSNQIDSNQLIFLIPIMAIIIPTIYLIRARMFNQINEANKSIEELEEEFKMKPKNFWEKIKQYF